MSSPRVPCLCMAPEVKEVAADLKELTVGLTTSAGEQVAGWVRGARVGKAFNTIGAGNIGRTEFAGHVADGFY